MGVKRNKLSIILVAVILLVATVVGAAAIDGGQLWSLLTRDGETAGDPPVIPEVVVVGNRVDGGTQYFELSLHVSASAFQTVGIVLSYDSTVLTPLNWATGSDQAEIPLTECIEAPWDNPTVLHTKGADALAGKPALAYQATEEDGVEYKDHAFLYLGADALNYTSLSDERVVTVRFSVADGATVTMPTADAADQGWSAPFTVDFAPAEIAAAAVPGSRLLATTAGAGVEPAAYTYGDTLPAAVSTLEDETDPGTGEETETPTEDPNPTTDPDPTDGPDPTEPPEPEEKKFTASFEFRDGPSAGAGSGGGGGGYAITFFDWDGKVIDAMSAEGDMVTAVAEFQKNMSVLGEKAGYDFSCWLEVQQEETGLVSKGKDANGEAIFVASADASYFDPAKADFSNVDHTMFVQAAYVENSWCNTGVTGGTSLFYSIDAQNAVYTRYGSASPTDGRYSITYTVRRLNSANQGVTKLRQPAIFVTMIPNVNDPTQNIISRIDLTNTDTTTFEVVPTRKIQRVQVTVIDTYGFAAWPSSSERSVATQCNYANFVLNGSWGYIRDQAIETIRQLGYDDCLDASLWLGPWANDADAATFSDGGLQIGNLNTAKNNILSYMRDLTPEQRAAVTQADLQKMINGSYTAPAGH